MTKLERMMLAVPNYYQFSAVYKAILGAAANELDGIGDDIDDLMAQMFIATATWGLIYWEESVGLPKGSGTDYEIRRSRVRARLFGDGNFSIEQLEDLAITYGTKIRAEVEVENYLVRIVFLEGMPDFLDEYDRVSKSFIHAHLGTEYKFEYYILNDISVFVEYARYIYSLPYCGTNYCGELPSNTTTVADLATTGINLLSQFTTVSQLLPYCGTLYAGGETI